MGIAGGIIVFVISWWLIFLMSLSVGVESQRDAGEIVPGSDPGAPVNPRLRLKAIIATVLSAVVWFAVDRLVATGVIPL